MNIPIDVQKTYESIERNLQDGDEYLKKYYDEKADAYDFFIIETKYVLAEAVASMANKFIGDGENLKCIDVGCGTGEVGFNLKKFGSKMVIDGFDISFRMLQKCKTKTKSISQNLVDEQNKNGAYADLIEGNIKEVNQTMFGKYDVAVCAGLFTKLHASSNDLESVVSMLKVGGIGFVSVKRECFIKEGYSEKIEELVSAGKIDEVNLSSVNMWSIKEYSEPADIIRFKKI